MFIVKERGEPVRDWACKYPKLRCIKMIPQLLACRNFFALQEQNIEQIIAAASDRLSDEKIEVRGVGCELLTSMLRCIPEEYVARFRDNALISAKAVFPSERAPGKPKDPRVSNTSTSATLHACALSLSAVLLSNPYVIEDWTGGVLLALARAVRLPAPTKESARKALGHFRKTQQGASMLPLRERLEPHVWDAVQDASIQSSYFV
jgi:hypothetical protein